MTPELAATIDRVRTEFGDVCFACGRDNPVGLHLEGFDLARDGTVTAHFEPRPEHVGAGDTLHGGIAATALDEVLVWAGILSEGVLCVTGTLDLRYRKPLTVGDRITVAGRVEERRGRRLVIAGRLDAGDGPAVEARGIYLATQPVELT